VTLERRTGIAGGLAGALNAWLCYAQVPVQAAGNATFKWHVIPAGAFHGAALAVGAMAATRMLVTHTWARRILMAPVVAWFLGFISWIPLNRSAFDEPWLRSLSWPFHESWAALAFAPEQYFGFVGGLLYLLLVFRKGRISSPLVWTLSTVACGVLGSLWWWIQVEPWYFSPLHGTIWGLAVAAGSWEWVRRVEPSAA
jgi:hypothetical protein